MQTGNTVNILCHFSAIILDNKKSCVFSRYHCILPEGHLPKGHGGSRLRVEYLTPFPIFTMLNHDLGGLALSVSSALE